jgi:SAM-dependent methyltransferase
MENYNYKSHWNEKYQSTQDEELGWYEDTPETTMQLVAKCELAKDASILNVGAGTTTLIDLLLDKGYSNILANDLSEVALEKLQSRIKKEYNFKLKCIADDLTNPLELNSLQNIDLWIDRAVLHFFLKQEEQQAYFDLIKKIVSKGGYVLIAVFSLEGAPKCCSLDLQRYNAEMLQSKLGNEFKLVETFNHTFINPRGGERPYVYTLFQRQ